MGRKKILKTEAERRRQAARWAATANWKRKKMYHEDADYREKCKQQSRETARRNRHVSSAALTRADACKDSLANTKGTMRETYDVNGNHIYDEATYSSKEMAQALGLSHVVVLHRWQRDGRFPCPTLRARIGRTHANVYTRAQAVLLLAAMEKHYRTCGSALTEMSEGTLKELKDAM